MFKEAALAGKEAFDEVARLSVARTMYKEQIAQAERSIESHNKELGVLTTKVETAKQNLAAAETRICSVVKSLA